ncbi:MAG TPA: hypothetical protein VD835_04590, partial [Pyrinomonadaceae bacterium]|nr:hypothetical protein [Pyrinomonadaceae bacterium]
TPPAPDGRKSSRAMLVGVACAVLAACAFVAFPLLKSPAVPTTNSASQAGTQSSGAPAGTQPLEPDATQTEATRQTSSPASASEQTFSPSLDQRTAVESQAPAGQSPSREAEASGNSGTNADGSNVLSPAVGASADKSGLVIQSPASSSPVGVNNAAAEYDAQRAEDLRRRKQQDLELQQQRQREQFRPPPPPHHGDGGHPPPGGERRPPPRRAPSFQ